MTRPIFETMTKAKVGIYTIRVWRAIDDFCFGDADMEMFINAMPGHSTVEEIYNKIKHVEDVSALEITTASGQGCVYYKERP